MTTSGRERPRGDTPLGRPGPRWDAGSIPPVAATTPEVREDERPRRAPYWRRIAAWLVDEVARTIAYVLVLMLVILFGGSVPEPATAADITLGDFVPQVLVRVALSWVFWSNGVSPGGLLLRVRIVDAQGRRPGHARGGVRALVEIVSLVPLLLGFASALLSRRGQTWHDLAAGTYVVNEADAVPAEREDDGRP